MREILIGEVIKTANSSWAETVNNIRDGDDEEVIYISEALAFGRALMERKP